MRYLLVLVFVYFSLVQMVRAEGMLMIGTGATSCDEYIKDISEDPSLNTVYLGWAHGYMSAINARNTRTDSSVNLASALTQDAQIAVLQDYCTRNSAKLFVFGVMILMELLGKT